MKRGEITDITILGIENNMDFVCKMHEKEKSINKNK